MTTAHIDEARTARTSPPHPTRSPGSAEHKMRMIYEVNKNSLMRSLLGWTHGDQQAAEDLVQETMLRAWRHLDILPDDPRSVRPWLLTVSRRLAIDVLRARASRPTEVEDDPLESIPVTAEPLEQILDRQVLRTALAGLSATHQAVLTQVYILHRPVRHAAQVLNVPEGTVKSRTHNALRALREALGDRNGARLRNRTNRTAPRGHAPSVQVHRHPGRRPTPVRVHADH
ncbi:sigma-70 family RNA polymerase sigma factor [Streptomyces pseudovenezuelae]|uniref:RNA polymerase sigma factor n=1 Tax=Streptomyces pseudovenezuelae TaxID=67350 RepID=A0ABT6LNR2_9ACTN|nr:sigma-70 family RNA polymerase sigma factor [Streptomyces pseudovenezuelae]MDH6217888.1 RNA polymerase sigma-70 factor (ECF subfamily) [Streptomyces pseudovenezuelae]